MSQQSLRVYALGGLGEFGKNLLVLQQGKDAVLVDCGAQFSDGRNPGLDIIIPDFSPILDPELTIHGIVLTHAHEDHIGSVAYFLHERNVPVWGTGFTHALVRHKCKEFFHNIKLNFHLIDQNSEFEVGPFAFHAVSMAHSIPEALGFFIDTSQGRLFHTGDFKLDDAPVDGWKTDLEKIKRLSEEKKVLLLTSDSTNVMVPGKSKSESSVAEGIEEAMVQTKGTLVVASFASHVPRITQICKLAVKQNRKILLLGRSVLQNTEHARGLKLFPIEHHHFVTEEEASKIAREKLVIICTGTQAEPRSALMKLTFGFFKGLNIGEDDRVLFSSRAIPGNERAIYHLINHIYRTGADVWTWEDARIHVSGHAYKEDLRTIIETVQPTYMLPVHGELRMLKRHQELAIECGVKPEHTFYLENGDTLEFVDGRVTQLDRMELSPRLVDRGMLVDLAASYLKDRKKLSLQGALMVVVQVDEKNNKLLSHPFATEFGFVEASVADDLLDEVEDVIAREMQKLSQKPFSGNLEQQIRMWVNRVCRRVLDRKPVILPMILHG